MAEIKKSLDAVFRLHQNTASKLFSEHNCTGNVTIV